MRKRILCAILAALTIFTAGCTRHEVPKATSPSTTPETTVPNVSEPSISEPGLSEPSVPEPSVSEPSASTVTEPSVTDPSVSEPSVSEPSVSEPDISEPTTTNPSESEPTIPEPSTTEPSQSEPPSTQPPITEPTIPTGWQEVNGKRYYYDPDGTPHIGWLTLSGERYYFREDGTMATGRVIIDGKETRYFTSSGKEVIMVNPWNFVPEDYKVTLTTYGDYQMASHIKTPLKQMLADCKAAGYDAVVVSAYRTHSYQKGLFQRRIERFMNQGYNKVEATIEAATRVAVPGTSEHELGLALDITAKDYQSLNKEQEKQPAQIWLMNNSWRYGFILRYPNEKSAITGIIYEPWHYRYVGVELATELHRLGLCLEEYLEMLTDPNEPTISHKCNYVFESSTAATCTSQGKAYYICTQCYRYDIRPIRVLGHSYKAATCTAPSTCTRCGDKLGDSLGHLSEPATCTAPSKCTRCGAQVAEPLAHDYGPDGLCTVCGAKDPAYVSTMDLTITVKTDKNAYVAGVTVQIYVDANLVDSKQTNEHGVAKFTIPICEGYEVCLTDVPEWLEAKTSYAYSSPYGNIVLKTKSVIDPTDHSQGNYSVGSTVGNFQLTDTDGNTHELYDLLNEKNVVVLNFWFVWCEPCKIEFPYLNAAYEQYKDNIALLAISPMDENPAIASLKEQMQLSFPMMSDQVKLSTGFNVGAFPTTVIIGQGGQVLFIHEGMFTSEEEVCALFAPFAQ